MAGSTRIDPHAAGSIRHSSWWVVQNVSGGRGGPPTYSIQQATSKPQNAVAGPFTSQSAAERAMRSRENPGSFPSPPNPVGVVQGWFSSLGGDIGSGIEAGLVYMLKDLWNVIWGPIEIGLGLVIAAFVLFFYFGGSFSQLGALMA